MSQLALIEILGRLLQDRGLRERLAKDRAAVAKELGIAADQASFIDGLNVHQLEAQAESLIQKRQHEVSRVIPETWSRLGRQWQVQFRQYAAKAAWPQGHRRHFIDAAMFCKFLKAKGVSGYLRSEHQRADFLAGNQRLSIRIVNDLIFKDKEHWAIQFCIRRKGFAINRAYRVRWGRKQKRQSIENLATQPATNNRARRVTMSPSTDAPDEMPQQSSVV
ncbi:MAG: hypothetical protein P8L85_10335 [Rubripirellula sp.]|nr:hypothetical protein [Rubripirellula sp.]